MKKFIFIFRFLGVLGVSMAVVLLTLRFAPSTSGTEAPWGNPGVLELRGVTLTQNTLSPEGFSQLKNDAQQDQALQHISGFYLQGKDLRGAILHEAVLPKIDLRAKTVSGLHDLLGCSRVPGNQQDRCRSRLDGVDFRWAYLQQAKLDEASLIDAKLEHARLREAVLIGADLRGADLRGADLSHTNFVCANLAGAKLEGANLQQANFKGARCAGATFDPTLDRTRCARLDRVSSPDDDAFCR